MLEADTDVGTIWVDKAGHILTDLTPPRAKQKCSSAWKAAVFTRYCVGDVGGNVEWLRRINEAQNRRDKAIWLEATDPDAVMIPAREWPENAPVRGAEAIWDFYGEVTGTWEEGSFELAETIDSGADVLVGNVHRRARGKASGVGFDFSYWVVITRRKGKAVRIEWFSDRAEALEAAGLSE